MCRVLWVIAFLTLGWVDQISAESLYRTTYTRPDDSGSFGSDDNFTFLAPYFTEVETLLSVSITKATASGNTGGGSGQGQGSSATKSPSILKAHNVKIIPTDPKSKAAVVKFTVSCDLQPLLKEDDGSYGYVGLTGVNYYPEPKPDEREPKTEALTEAQIAEVGANFVTVVVQKPIDLNKKAPIQLTANSAISNVNCPLAADTLNITFTVTPVGKTRGYLHLRHNFFFSDSVNVAIGGDGLLSSSDSSSAQQITAILNEVAQTAALFGNPPKNRDKIYLPPDKEPALEDIATCYQSVANLVKSGPFYNSKRLPLGLPRWTAPIVLPGLPGHTGKVIPPLPYTVLEWPAHEDDTVSLYIKFKPLVDRTLPIGSAKQDEKPHDGLVAFFPSPATATIFCRVKNKKGANPARLSAPQIVSLYTQRYVFDPQRDFFTNPQDTFTFNAGIITGHKYAGQSPARTIVDTITGPIRSIMPSVTVTQTNTVTSSGGKVTGGTDTTTTTTAPPKGP